MATECVVVVVASPVVLVVVVVVVVSPAVLVVVVVVVVAAPEVSPALPAAVPYAPSVEAVDVAVDLDVVDAVDVPDSEEVVVVVDDDALSLDEVDVVPGVVVVDDVDDVAWLDEDDCGALPEESDVLLSTVAGASSARAERSATAAIPT
ncbi:hypothetical protein [Blastococcus sp. TBT05-19]|uniref:hypothetical protein n=1 Tax=Blastococcus sp. TBT05-19 TaxID=2250581 RepID=UPI0011BD816A|nr:hypothetical protein [Blastococcus sp. TBT05-19]